MEGGKKMFTSFEVLTWLERRYPFKWLYQNSRFPERSHIQILTLDLKQFCQDQPENSFSIFWAERAVSLFLDIKRLCGEKNKQEN